jgi:hypothetical protein
VKSVLKIAAYIALSIASSFISAWCLIEHSNAWWAFPGGLWGIFLSIAFTGLAIFELKESRQT